MSSNKTIHYGWFSVKQSKIGGTVYYRTPDGGQVEVTQVTSDKDHGTKWDDIAYVGEVTEYVGRASEGSPENTALMDENLPLEKRIAMLERLIATNKDPKNDPNRWN